MAPVTTAHPRRPKRRKPLLGDAIITDWIAEHMAPDFVAVIAQCECGGQVYSAVSHSHEAARKLIYRKHGRHLPNCKKQAELYALDETVKHGPVCIWCHARHGIVLVPSAIVADGTVYPGVQMKCEDAEACLSRMHAHYGGTGTPGCRWCDPLRTIVTEAGRLR